MRKLLGYGILVLLVLAFFTFMGLCVGFLLTAIIYGSIIAIVGLIFLAIELITY